MLIALRASRVNLHDPMINLVRRILSYFRDTQESTQEQGCSKIAPRLPILYQFP